MIKKLRARLNQVKPSVVFLVLSIITGGYLRIKEALAAAFPLNDGGLFYMMTQELVANHFRLPLFTSYNHLQIPFAYPPLAFYFTGALHQIFGWELLDVYRLFPAIVAILTIPAFYLLAKDLSENDNQLSLAILIFTLLPATFDWAIMGGGVTRSLAFLFALLALHFTFLLFTKNRLRHLIFSALLLSLCILSHPETGFHTAFSVPVLWFFLSRKKQGVWQTLIMAVITLALTAPWWGSVAAAHGFQPFMAALSTAEQNGYSFFDLFNLQLTDELQAASIALFAFVGIFLALSRKKYFLPVWLLISYAVAPRSAKIFIAPVVAVLAAQTVCQLAQWLDSKKAQNESTSFLSSAYSKLFLALLFFQWFSSAMLVLRPFSYFRLDQADAQAFEWVKENSTPDSRFVIITDHFWSSDPASEWFPALTGRISTATVQGTEWLGGGRYLDAIQEARELQFCVDQSPACIEAWAQTYAKDFDYIYVRKMKVLNAKELVPYDSGLAGLLTQDAGYSLVYQSEEAAIFSKSK